jgi:hypothetical protein
MMVFMLLALGIILLKSWNTNNECVNSIKKDDWVCSLLSLPGGNIASGTKAIKIWKCVNDYKDIRCIHTLTGHAGCVHTLYLVNNDFILSGSGDKQSKSGILRITINALTP